MVAEALGWGFNTNSWEVLLKKTVTVQKPFMEDWKSKMRRQGTLTNEELVKLSRYARVKAIHFWMYVATPATRDPMKKNKLKEYSLMEYERMLVMRSRAPMGIGHHYGQEFLPVVIASTRVAELVMWHAHCSQHKSVSVTIAISRAICFIVGARREEILQGLCEV